MNPLSRAIDKNNDVLKHRTIYVVLSIKSSYKI